MYCKNCGNELKDGVKFCDKCGAKFETDVDKNSSEINQIHNQTSEKSNVKLDHSQ